MEILGVIGLLMMGVTLGLIGAGGSILTIPILVYLLNIPIVIATTYSLLIVGSTALVGAIRYRNSIHFKRATFFTIPSLIGVYIARALIIPNLPQTLLGLSIDQALTLLLLIFMAFAGFFMIKNIVFEHHQGHITSLKQQIKVALLGLGLGLIMGILGAGGGFLIIPTLVVLMGFKMHEAVPTSLFIITMNSFVGFISDKTILNHHDIVNLLQYLMIAIAGILLGIYITNFIKSMELKKIFGYFVWIIACVIFVRQFIF